jgi:hypothetical protein
LLHKDSLITKISHKNKNNKDENKRDKITIRKLGTTVKTLMNLLAYVVYLLPNEIQNTMPQGQKE